MPRRQTEKELKYHRDWMRNTYHSNPAARIKRLASGRTWREKNREVYLAGLRNRNLRRKFGITSEQYDEILKLQKGACALCRRLPNKGRRLAVDHNHEDKAIRGLLCAACNRALGLIEKRIGSLMLLFFYLQRNSWEVGEDLFTRYYPARAA